MTQSTEANDGTELSASRLTRAARRHLVVVLLLALLGGAAGTALAQLRPDTYESTIRLQVNAALEGSEALSGDGISDQEIIRRRGTVIADIGSQAFAEEVRRSVPEAARAGEVEVLPVPDTAVVEVVASGGTPAAARALAQGYGELLAQRTTDTAQAAVAPLRTSLQQRLDAVQVQIELLTRQSSSPVEQAQATSLVQSRQDLGAQLERLDAVERDTTARTGVLDPADEPAAPVGLSAAETGVLGALFGLLLGVAAALLLDGRRARVHTAEDLRLAVPQARVAAVVALGGRPRGALTVDDACGRLVAAGLGSRVRLVGALSLGAGEPVDGLLVALQQGLQRRGLDLRLLAPDALPARDGAPAGATAPLGSGEDAALVHVPARDVTLPAVALLEQAQAVLVLLSGTHRQQELQELLGQRRPGTEVLAVLRVVGDAEAPSASPVTDEDESRPRPAAAPVAGRDLRGSEALPSTSA